MPIVLGDTPFRVKIGLQVGDRVGDCFLNRRQSQPPQRRSDRYYVELFRFLRTGVWGAVWVGGFVSAVLIARAFAGRATVADIGVGLIVRAYAHLGSAKVAWPITFVSIVYAELQRRERLRKTEKLAKRNRELEHRLDPGRTSSQLTPTGETREEDR